MNGIPFDPMQYSLTVNVLILAVGGVVVWVGGTKLSTYAHALSEKTGLGHAFVGALFLGGATSLPELATTLSAANIGNATLAVNNLFGGIAMQFAILAIVDMVYVQGALTFFSPKPVLLLGGVLLILLISLALAAFSAGEIFSVANIGLWPLLIFATYAASLWFMQRFERQENWVPAELPESSEPNETKPPAARESSEASSLLRIGLLFSGNALLVLLGGWAISLSGDAIARQTPLGSGFVGATLVALTTSLPEVSTTIAAVKLHAYTMAVANIIGTNSLEVALLFPADLAYRDGLIISAADPSVLFVGALGIVITSLYLWGILERRNKTIARMGTDSALVLLVYLTGLILLYRNS